MDENTPLQQLLGLYSSHEASNFVNNLKANVVDKEISHSQLYDRALYHHVHISLLAAINSAMTMFYLTSPTRQQPHR